MQRSIGNIHVLLLDKWGPVVLWFSNIISLGGVEIIMLCKSGSFLYVWAGLKGSFWTIGYETEEIPRNKIYQPLQSLGIYRCFTMAMHTIGVREASAARARWFFFVFCFFFWFSYGLWFPDGCKRLWVDENLNCGYSRTGISLWEQRQFVIDGATKIFESQSYFTYSGGTQ